MKELNFKVRVTLLVITVIISGLSIYFRASYIACFVFGILCGMFALMALRTWLWNTSEFIKGE